MVSFIRSISVSLMPSMAVRLWSSSNGCHLLSTLALADFLTFGARDSDTQVKIGISLLTYFLNHERVRGRSLRNFRERVTDHFVANSQLISFLGKVKIQQRCG